jgi:hypothetical protein
MKRWVNLEESLSRMRAFRDAGRDFEIDDVLVLHPASVKRRVQREEQPLSETVDTDPQADVSRLRKRREANQRSAAKRIEEIGEEAYKQQLREQQQRSKAKKIDKIGEDA